MKILELKVPPVIQALLVALLMWLASTLTPSLAMSIAGHFLLGSGFLIAGAGCALSGVWAFRMARTTVDPTQPESTATIVSSGIYGVSRNPMYLGFLMALAGWAFLLSHSLAFLLLPVFVAYMNRFQIAPEERALLLKFGKAYSDYLTSVRRW